VLGLVVVGVVDGVGDHQPEGEMAKVRAAVVNSEVLAELAAACELEFERCDVLLMAAAVADFRPRNPAQRKLKKDAGAPAIELEPTEDVLSALAQRRRPGQIVVGFAAEHGEGAVGYGREKLERKRLDAIVVNDISGPQTAFDSPENEVTILTSEAEQRVSRTSKELVARAVLDVVERLLSRKEGAGAAAGAHAPSGAGV